MSLRNRESLELLRAHPAKMAAEASFYHDEYKEQNNINKSSVGDSESGRLCIHRIYLTFAGQNDLGCYILLFQGGGGIIGGIWQIRLQLLATLRGHTSMTCQHNLVVYVSKPFMFFLFTRTLFHD